MKLIKYIVLTCFISLSMFSVAQEADSIISFDDIEFVESEETATVEVENSAAIDSTTVVDTAQVLTAQEKK